MKTLKLNFIGQYGTISKEYPILNSLDLTKQLHFFVEKFLCYVDRDGVRDVDYIVNGGDGSELDSVHKVETDTTIEISFT